MGFSLNHAFVFLVVFVSVFAILYTGINTEFFVNQPAFELEYKNAIVLKESFEANDLILYSLSGFDNMTYAYSSLYDHPSFPQFNVSAIDRYLEVWWSAGDYGVPQIQIRDVSRTWWGGWGYTEKCVWKTVDNIPLLSNGVPRDFISEETGEYLGTPYVYTDLSDNWNGEASIFYASSSRIQVSIMFLPTNSSKTITEAWNDDEISYVLSYEINFDAMKPDAWSLVTQLVTFQTVDLGMPEEPNTIFSYLIGVAIWAVTALLIFALITSVIPTISGWRGD